MRTTKTTLEAENKFLRERLQERENEIVHLRQLIEVYSKPREHLESFVMATEKITEALAHVIGDLKRRQ